MSPTTYLLDAIRISDVMRPGLIECDSRAPIEEVADRMSRLGIHALAIRDDDRDAPVVVSDLDVVAAIGTGERGLQARHIAGRATFTVPSRHSMREAARLMSEHAVSHLVVIDEAFGSPCGIVSSTDVLAAYASVTSG